MKILITGICGFAGSTITEELAKRSTGYQLFGLNNLSRAGSELNLPRIKRCGVRFFPGDTQRPFDIPWIVLDSSRAERLWGWRGATPVGRVLDEIAEHAVAHPEWLDLSSNA
jgi:nucleoside-diphosphate-sugar epimerase